MKDTITVFVTDLDGKIHEILAPTDMSLSLMEVIRLNELPIKATCGGMAMCATCNCIVNSNHKMPIMKEAEEDMLDEAFVLHIEGSRLSCQIPISEDLDGLEVTLGLLTAE